MKWRTLTADFLDLRLPYSSSIPASCSFRPVVPKARIPRSLPGKSLNTERQRPACLRYNWLEEKAACCELTMASREPRELRS